MRRVTLTATQSLVSTILQLEETQTDILCYRSHWGWNQVLWPRMTGLIWCAKALETAPFEPVTLSTVGNNTYECCPGLRRENSERLRRCNLLPRPPQDLKKKASKPLHSAVTFVKCSCKKLSRAENKVAKCHPNGKRRSTTHICPNLHPLPRRGWNVPRADAQFSTTFDGKAPLQHFDG